MSNPKIDINIKDNEIQTIFKWFLSYFILYKTPYQYACNDNFKSLIDYDRLENEHKHLGLFWKFVIDQF